MLSKQERNELIKQDLLSGRSYTQILQDYDVSTSTISEIRKSLANEGLELPKNKYSGWRPTCGRKAKEDRQPMVRLVAWNPSKLIEYRPKHKAPLIKDEYGTRCDFCRHKVVQCLNCYSKDLLGRYPIEDGFQFIESKTAI